VRVREGFERPRSLGVARQQRRELGRNVDLARRVVELDLDVDLVADVGTRRSAQSFVTPRYAAPP
jgi:hypothetical protein